MNILYQKYTLLMFQRILFTGQSGLRSDNNPPENFYTSFLDGKYHFIKFEDIIKENYSKKSNTQNPRSIWLGKFLQQPPDIVQKEWREALNTIIQNFEKEGIEKCVIALHAVFYNYRTNEYICPVSEQILKNIKPEVIITLIDDIFDIHDRLKESGHIFCPSNGGSDTDDPNGLLYELIRILDWRANEIMVSRHLAMELGIKHYLVAIKHEHKLLKNLIVENKETVYISHPITQVRNLQQLSKVKKANSIITEIHQFEMHASENFAAFLPTTIDEYRFKKEVKKNKQVYTTTLLDRWDKEKYNNKYESMFEKNLKENVLLWRKRKNPKCNLDKLLWIIAKMIEKQINVRDHFLVEQCNSLLVYRPCYEGIASEGVIEEIEYFSLLEKDNKKCLVYLPKIDKEEFIIKQFEVLIENQLRDGRIKRKGKRKEIKVKLKPTQRKRIVENFDRDSIIFVKSFLDEEKLIINVQEKPLKDKMTLSQNYITQINTQFSNTVNRVLGLYKSVGTLYIEDIKKPQELIDIFINSIKEG